MYRTHHDHYKIWVYLEQKDDRIKTKTKNKEPTSSLTISMMKE